MKYSDIKHIGNGHERTQGSTTEKIFADEWEKRNKRIVVMRGSYGILELLLNPVELDHANHLKLVPVIIDKITQRDAYVAATVIQWLGTNVGKCFLENCEQKIEKARKIEQQEFHEKHNLHKDNKENSIE